ncbi:MAG: DUF58 domain-containing protein [Thermosynechococcaceae cyanobacterium MS004]|nr:DUF58 domain-containing protein [Thermosynechococcaceae cyanobacterium MS004]
MGKKFVKLLKYPFTWLERRSAVPAYGGWVLLGLMLCFWLAAANTMAGWLYVLSGLGVALLLLAAVLPIQMLRGIELTRSPLYPIHAGESLTLTLQLWNRTKQTKGLLLVADQVPAALGERIQTAVEAIAPQMSYTWQYRLEPQHRGVYQWDAVTLRTGAPLGLFWSQRQRTVPGKALVYPRVLPLTRCPILDEVGASAQQLQQVPVAQAGQEGSTRSLRPYRIGDPMRLVHWRSSARYGELRIRELERFNGGHTVAIALDLSAFWHPDHFEQAVIAAASLYIYAEQRYGDALLWTALSGMLQGKQSILEALAAVQIDEQNLERRLPPEVPNQPVTWLTASPESIYHLPSGSRYISWTSLHSGEGQGLDQRTGVSGLVIHGDKPLQVQLQSQLYSKLNPSG